MIGDRSSKEILEEEIVSEIEALGNQAPGSKEHAAAVESLVKLYQLKIEETRNEWDFNEKYDRRIIEEEARKYETSIKERQLSEQVKDRYFKLGIETAGIVLPLIFYGIWMKRGLKFEETGTFTSNTFKGLFNRFKATK